MNRTQTMHSCRRLIAEALVPVLVAVAAMACWPPVARAQVAPPNLRISDFSRPKQAAPGQSVNLIATVTNVGPGPAAASYLRYYWSTDHLPGPEDIVLGHSAVPALASGASSALFPTAVVIPSYAPGVYYIIAVADVFNVVPETNETDNIRHMPIKPDLIVSALNGPSAVQVPGAVVSLTDTTRNEGLGPVGQSYTYFYLSADTTVGTGSDYFLGRRAVPALAGKETSGPVTTAVTLPAVVGTYNILAQADGGYMIPAEESEGNNVKSWKITVGPDLIVSALGGPPAVAPGQAVSLSETTMNQGPVAAAASYTSFYWSLDNAVGSGDYYLGSRAVPALAGGQSSGPATTTVTIPMADTGTYYLLAKANATGTFAEASETNNVRARKVSVGPDLVVSDLANPSAVAVRQAFSVTDTTRNQGTTAAAQSATVFYWSWDGSYDAGDFALGSRAVPALAPGESSTQTTQVSAPSGAGGVGTYYILARADFFGAVPEGSESNNIKASAIKIGPDLIVSALSGASAVVPGQSVTLSETTRNDGADRAAASYTRYYWSTDATYQATDILLAEHYVPSLPPYTSDTASTAMMIPMADGGTYYVVARSDATGVVAEASEGNNVTALKVRIAPDLVVPSLSAPQSALRGLGVTIGETTANTGTLDAGASSTRYYLSKNTTYDSTDLFLAARVVPPIARGTSHKAIVTPTVPAAALPGVYYLLAVADATRIVSELSETNNTKAVRITIM